MDAATGGGTSPPIEPRPPTAPLPGGRARVREVSAVPPPRPDVPVEGLGVAARIVPDDAARPRRTRQELLRFTITGARLLALAAVPAVRFAAGLPGTTSPPVDGTVEAISLGIGLVLTLALAWRWSDALPTLVAEALVVTGLLAASGGPDGPMLLFAVATTFRLGVGGGAVVGLPAAAVFAITAVVFGDAFDVGPLTEELRDELVLDTLVISALFPLSAFVGDLASRLIAANRAGQAMLMETNRVLGDLERLTAAAPEALSPATVATAAAAEFRRALDAGIALVLFERHGALVELGRDGEVDAGPYVILDAGWEELVRGSGPRPLDAGNFPVRLTRQLPNLPTWVAVPLRAREHRVGVVLVGVDAWRDTRATRERLRDLAAETSVALDNTQLFARIEQAAATSERQRLASDLHDGVAQQLTHVRLELELLARRTDDEGLHGELVRLARVAERATDEVRTSIRGLRAQALDEGLVPALRSLVTDLTGASGPRIELDVRGAVETDPDVTAELYRIVQEALSNALRHAEAATVEVEIDVVGGTLLLAVEDDGHGLAGPGAVDGDGLGLRTMRARAERLGAHFVLRPGDDGGTRMELRMPVEEARNG